MFTGIISEVGAVAAYAGGKRLRVRCDRAAAALALGGSIAVDGACLTAVATGAGFFEADVSSETAARTTLGELRPGDAVNLELPVAAGAPLGGHIVQGHVDGVGRVKALERDGAGRVLRVALPAGLEAFVVAKGSLAVAGISLTVAAVADGDVTVAVVPYTYENTTLRRRRPGDGVNVEVDILAKYVARFLAGRDTQGLTAERLAALGFAE